MMGLEYATGGTMTVAGKKLVVIEKDDQGKPDLGKAAAGRGLWRRQGRHRRRPDRRRPWRWRCCRWPRRTRRSCSSSRRWPTRSPATSGTTTSSAPAATPRQDAIANAAALDKRGQRRSPRWRRTTPSAATASKAFKDALKKAKIVHEEYLPAGTTDFTAGRAAPLRRAEGQAGHARSSAIIWAGAGNPLSRSPTWSLKRYGIEIATGGNILPAMAAYKKLPGHGRRALLLLRHPEEPGERLAGGRALQALQGAAGLLHRRRLGAAIAVVEALKKTSGDTDTEKLIAAMEGMSFETPKGKMTFRKEDHQALQDMYHFKIKVDPAFAWGVPELVREIKAEEMHVPIRNKR